MSNKQEKPLVSIIILNYNAGSLLLDCVDSVFKSNYMKLLTLLNLFMVLGMLPLIVPDLNLLRVE